LIDRKSGTAVLTTWTFFYGLFYIDYGSHDHCFTDIQRWYRNKIDGLLGIDAQAVVKQISAADDNDNNNNAIMPDERNFGLGFIRNTTTQLAGEVEATDIDEGSKKKKKRFWLF
jgi:hypothetical protein